MPYLVWDHYLFLRARKEVKPYHESAQLSMGRHQPWVPDVTLNQLQTMADTSPARARPATWEDLL